MNRRHEPENLIERSESTRRAASRTDAGNRSPKIVTVVSLAVAGLLLLPALAEAGPRRAHRRGHHPHHQVHTTSHGKVVVSHRVVVVRGPDVVVYKRAPARVVVEPTRSYVVQRRYDDWGILSHRGFESAKQALDDAPFTDDKLAIIRDVARGWLLTTRQAMELAEEVTFSDDRVEALVFMYPSIVDPENFFEAYELLPFSDDRAELRRRTGRD